MASLRQGYEEWVLNEPEEPQSDRPTDEEMAVFADAEKKHEDEVRSPSRTVIYRYSWSSHYFIFLVSTVSVARTASRASFQHTWCWKVERFETRPISSWLSPQRSQVCVFS